MGRWLTDDEHRAWRGLLQMTAQVDALLNRQLQEDAGLSRADYDVLVPLSEAPQGRRRVFELASALCWEQSRLSHHLARMQKRGLVEREDCRDDRRGAFIVLTAAGRCAIEGAAGAHVDAVRQLVFDQLDPEQVQALSDITRKVIAGLADDRTSPTRTRMTRTPVDQDPVDQDPVDQDPTGPS